MPWQRIAVFEGHAGAVYALRPEGGGHFLSAAGDGRVVRWDLADPQHGTAVATVAQAIFALHASAHGLCLGLKEGALHVLDLAHRRELHQFTLHQRGLFAFAALGDQLFTAGGDGTICLWNVRDWSLERQVPLTDGKLRGLALSPDGTRLAVACGDGRVRVLETTHLNEQMTLEAHAEGANCVAWHPGKPVLATAGRDGVVKLWETRSFRGIYQVQAHAGTIYAMAFGPTNGLLATAGRDKSAKLWNSGTFDPVARLDHAAGGHVRSVNTLAWCADGTLLTAGDDRKVLAWRDQKG